MLTFTWYLAQFTPACELVTLTLNSIRLFTSHSCALTLFCDISSDCITWFVQNTLEGVEGTKPSLPRLHLVWWLDVLDLFLCTLLHQPLCMPPLDSISWDCAFCALSCLALPLRGSPIWHWRDKTLFHHETLSWQDPSPGWNGSSCALPTGPLSWLCTLWIVLSMSDFTWLLTCLIARIGHQLLKRLYPFRGSLRSDQREQPLFQFMVSDPLAFARCILASLDCCHCWLVITYFNIVKALPSKRKPWMRS